MRITRNQLQDLINEEISLALLRAENRRLIEAREPGGPLYNVAALSLINFAKAYLSLGGSVQQQLDELLSLQDEASVSIGAFDAMEQALRGHNRELDAAMDSWYGSYSGEEEADTM